MTTASSSDDSAKALVDKSVIQRAGQVEVLDKHGSKHSLASLLAGKRTCLVFIRHFWCLNCQAYVRGIGEQIPPASLPQDTQIVVIGCGTHHPIETYETKSASPWPIYTNPDLFLYQLFEFKSTLAGEAKGEPVRDYMQDAGSYSSRIWGGIKGALSDLGNVSNVGPKSQNGGEVIISREGECEYIYRMQNTVDHTNLSELSKLLKASATPSP